MALFTASSPHTHGPTSTHLVMLHVLLATLPGIIALTIIFGWGTLINIVIAASTAIVSEALILSIRKKPIGFYLKDNSALVTAVLLAIAIPPFSPWWLTVIGTSFAIIVAKQLYGGLGFNPFNPAMVGYVLLLISFPIEMTAWAPIIDTVGGRFDEIGFLGYLGAIFSGHIHAEAIDAFTMATPLDTFKTYAGNMEKIQDHAVLDGIFAGRGWEWVNVTFLLGGLYLLHKKIISWHIPVSFIVGLGLSATIFAVYDIDNYGSPIFHLLSGGAMLGAFFIATDPVSAATSNKGRIIYGFGIGALVYIIRTWGGYPDAIAFAVLLFNLAAPTIDYYTQPRTYGHSQPSRRSNDGGSL